MDTNVSTYWKDCTFHESDGNILYCSETQLIFPSGAFRSWFSEITSIKSGRSKEHYQEYLINDQKIFKVKGGSNWEISYISTLEEREKSEKEFGKIMLNRARCANVPWHIAKLTKKIESDDNAISLLIRIRKIAKKKQITSEQIYALRSVDLELRLVTLELILGKEIYSTLKDTLIKNEKLSRLLAYYIAFRGKVDKHDLHKQCKIPVPSPIRYFEQFEHNQRLRIILADIPKELVAISDSIESNEEAIELLKKVKLIALNSELSLEESSALKSTEDEIRDNMLRKILGNEIWEKITLNNDLAYFLGYYIRCKGKIS